MITRPLNALGLEWLADQPPILQDSNHVQGIINAYTKEAQMIQDRIDSLILELYPQTATAVGLPFFEAILGLTINPVGASVTDRRALVMAHFLARPTAAGSEFQAALMLLIGASYTYAEHDPPEGNGGSPVASTILITLPFPSSSSLYAQARSLVRLIMPAHIDLVVTSSTGFQLDAGTLDNDVLG